MKYIWFIFFPVCRIHLNDEFDHLQIQYGLLCIPNAIHINGCFQNECPWSDRVLCTYCCVHKNSCVFRKTAVFI